MTRIGVLGAKGRVGSRLCALIEQDPELKLFSEIDVDTDLETALESLRKTDVLIDFTAAEITSVWQKNLIDAGVFPAMVIGSTGWNDESKKVLQEYTSHAPVMQENNMSVGANLTFEIARYASELLKNDGDVDIEIVETHHKHKKDAPSGTAWRIFEAVNEGLGRSVKAVTDRSSLSRAREKDEIGIQALRGGDVIGEHTVTFYKSGELIEITHRASNRDLFARGAIGAAKWLNGKAPGLYSMDDVLNIRS